VGEIVRIVDLDLARDGGAGHELGLGGMPDADGVIAWGRM
jgi:hypothetical protein